MGATPAANSPEEFAEFVRAEIPRWGKVVKASGATVDWPVVAFSPRKASLVLYIDHDDDLLARLGKHKLGKGCLYITKLSDVEESVLRELISRTVG